MISTVVVLPAPLGPSNPKQVPSVTLKLTPSTATTPGYRLTRFLASSAICIGIRPAKGVRLAEGGCRSQRESGRSLQPLRRERHQRGTSTNHGIQRHDDKCKQMCRTDGAGYGAAGAAGPGEH